MNDEMTLTLNSPITDEQWDAITDVDFEYTDRIWFNTKHGKTVEFIKKASVPRWIPCSERLPEEDREVLITAWRDTVMIAWLDDGEWTNDAVTFTDSSMVNAWMPLPEPWKEEEG